MRPEPTTIDIAQRAACKQRTRLLCALALVACACSTDAEVFSAAHPESRRPVVSGTAGNSTDASRRAGSGGSSARVELPRVVLTDDIGPDNPAGLSPAEVAELMKGGPTQQATRWLYPYDGTVFPRGLKPPLVMWHSDVPPDVIYLHMYSSRFEYKGVLPTGIPSGALFTPANNAVLNATLLSLQTFAKSDRQTAVMIPKLAWDAASKQSQGASDPLTIELTQRAAGAIQGPLQTKVIIARAAIKGSLYYNTCASIAAVTDGTSGGMAGKLLRVPFDGNAEVVSLNEGNQCVGCHAISSDGSRALAQRMTSTADLSLTGPTIYALSYQLTPTGLMERDSLTPIAPGPAGMSGPVGANAALYPDGSKFLTSTALVPLAYQTAGSVTTAALYDSNTGEMIVDTGIPRNAAMPRFSPDGRFLAFTNGDVDGARELAIMDYDVHSHKATNYRSAVHERPEEPMRPGWPAFLPDNRALVFVRTSDPTFSGTSQAGLGGLLSAGVSGVITKPTTPSDLYIVDLQTGSVTLLAKAMGYHSAKDAADDTLTYLPFPDDLHYNFYPAISPVAAGGYFWLFFDSLRHFGSLGAVRLLWAAAIDVRPDGNYASDPSHPPFLISGQEFSPYAHFRAFAALNRCEPEGAACKTGIDCCTGVCESAGNTLVEPMESLGTCAPEVRMCAHRDDRCSATSDCCEGGGLACINNFCAQVELL